MAKTCSFFFCFVKSEPDFGNLMLEEINQNNEDSIAYIFDEKTPIKNCIAEPIITGNMSTA